jgi:hypothetical protein
VGDIIGVVSRPSKDPPPENGTPSLDFPEDTGERPPLITAQNVHDLDSDLDIDSEFDIDTNSETAEKLSSHFIYLWQHNPDYFNYLSRIQKPKDWEAFWKSCTLSEKDLDIRVKNFVDGVKSGAIERRFIPASPDAFVLRGHLQRSAEPYKKQGKTISNDNVDDTSQYFREV